jgi:glycosyltransferase involved in cell wall biosynthesis
MKRVLIVIKGLGRGGAEQLLVSAAPYLDRSRFEYHFAYVLPHKDALVTKLTDFGFSVHCVGGGPKGSWITRLRRLARDFDLVHVHSPVPATALRVTRKPRFALVCTEHNVWGRYHRATYWANRLTFSRNDHVLAVSQEVHRSIQALPWGGWPPVETLYHGPDRAELARWRGTDGVREEFGIAEDAPLIGTVANFKAHKGYPHLMTAAAAVCRELPSARFVLVGQGPLEPEIKARARELEIDGAVIFTGYREDVPRLMAAFDVFAMSSLHEGLSIALLEAMSLGKPPVVTRVGGLPEVVGTDEGFVVEPADPQALADRIITLLREPELRARVGLAARRRAESFDISHTVARTESIYDGILS